MSMDELRTEYGSNLRANGYHSDTAYKAGEVIAASTTEFIAQSYELHQAPAFGSLIRVSDGQGDIYAITYLITTGSIDPGRRPIPRGRDEENEDAIYRNNPELVELLRTEFSALVVGYRDAGGQIHHWLPPRPPRMHSFVWTCDSAQIRAFTNGVDFLQTLTNSSIKAPVDELIAAVIRQAAVARGINGNPDRAFLIKCGKELALQMMNDMTRLNGILARLRV